MLFFKDFSLRFLMRLWYTLVNRVAPKRAVFPDFARRSRMVLNGFVSHFYVNGGTHEGRGGGLREGTRIYQCKIMILRNAGGVRWRSGQPRTRRSRRALGAKYFSILLFCHTDNDVSAPYRRYYKLISYEENNSPSQRK